MIVECRSPEQIDEDYMFEAEARLQADLKKGWFSPNDKPLMFLRGEKRNKALSLLAHIRSSIESGEVLSASSLSRRMFSVYC